MTQLLAIVSLSIASLVRPGPALDLPPTQVEFSSLRAQTELIVTTERLENRLDDVIVVEVGRDRRDFRTAHITGARFLDWRDITVETAQGIELPDRARLERGMSDLGIGNSASVVLYSRNVLESTWAWFALDSLGHGDRAAILDGGWAKWLREGRPVAGGEFVPRREVFVAVERGDASIGLDELRRSLGSTPVRRPFVVDARASEEYSGRVAGRSVRRAGHIPGAYSIAWTRNLEIIDGVAVFRLPESLRALYTAGESTGNGEVVVYCRTGLEASMTYFVLRTLGLEPRLYTGSYVEWSVTPEVPVARTAVR